MQPSSPQPTGRNDPCPCGSGKKYKRCCLPATWAQPTRFDTPWGRQREASDRLTPALLKLAAREFGEDLDLAWKHFNQDSRPEPIGKYLNEEGIFYPYLIFDWDPFPRRRRSSKPRAGYVLGAYLEKNAQRLSELEMRIVLQAISRPVSFYEVVRCDPGRSVALRDILIGEETHVEEHSATKSMRPGDLVYGQIWILPEVATLGRLAPRVISPDRKVAIVELRNRLRRKIAKQDRDLSASDLLRYAGEIRTVYLDIRDAMFRPKKLVNTDGETFIFHALNFRVGSAQAAFDALAPLAWNVDKAEILEDAERNPDGSLESVEFDWIGKGNRMHKNWDNTILGHLAISGRSLTVEVNSARRAERIRAEIEKRLGLHVTHLSTTSRTPEEAFANRKAEENSPPKQVAPSKPLSSETLREFSAMMQEEVEAWVHKKIPALGGRTPMEAVKDADGREIVESLLLGWERAFEGPNFSGSVRPDIDAVRRQLNLPVAIGTVIH